MDNENSFEYRTTPKNDWELVLWVVTDRQKVKKYVERLQNKEKSRLFFKIYLKNGFPIITGISFLCWLLAITFVAYFDMPNQTSAEWWKSDFINSWQQIELFHLKWKFLFEEQIVNLLVGWIIGLPLGLFFGAILGFGEIFELDFGFGLAIGWCFWLYFTIGGGLVIVMGCNLIIGLIFGFLFTSIIGLVPELFFGFILGFMISQENLWGGFLSYSIGYFMAICSVFFCHLAFAHLRSSLFQNYYFYWGNVNISLLLEQKLILQAREQPQAGVEFADFLWEHRPKQQRLAALLNHAARAELLKKAAIYLDDQGFNISFYPVDYFRFRITWQMQIQVALHNLIAAEKTNLISARLSIFHDFLTRLGELHKELLQVPPKTWRNYFSMTRRINWYKFYAEALEEWIKVAREKYAELQDEAKFREPITSNLYQTGGALSPKYNEAVFMQRDDLKDKLSTLLYTTQNFSVFFLQGQRRVGKTSLLKFLPQLLGRRFEIVYFDVEGSVYTIPDFLEKWHETFMNHFKLNNKIFPKDKNWGKSCLNVLKEFQQVAKANNVKIILAIDEYENLHKHLAKEPEQAENLLGAIRHFSQHQSDVSIMFVGLQFFSELKNPNWNEYFPQSVPIRVDYLNREKTFQLIEVSGLDFEEGFKERIWDLAQGHPSLIQKICYELVQIANRDCRRLLTHADLDESLRTMIYISVNGVTDIFWTQNCEQEVDKDIVRAIVEGHPMPSDSKQRLRRLIEYGFVVEEKEGYRLRVPIFEEWVRLHG